MTPTSSVAVRVKVTTVEFVYKASLLILTEPEGLPSGGSAVVNDDSLPYDVPALFDAAMR